MGYLLLLGSAGSRGTTAATGKLQTHHFALLFWLSLLCLTRTNAEAGTIQTNLAVIVQHAPTLDGGGVIQGSLQQLDGENVTVNGGFEMTGDLLVPGTPAIVANGNPAYKGTIPGGGSSSPSGYQVILNGNCSFNYLRTRTTPVALPSVPAPPSPTGTRTVTITQTNQSYGSADTLLNLTLNGNTGLISVPPGTYGNFAVNGGSGLVIGVAGAVQPATYNLQNLTLNGTSILKVVGPVVLTVANGFTANGSVGSSNNPAWLQLDIASGGFTLNGGCIVYGLVAAPGGEVIINGNSTLVGTSASANFILNGNGLVRWGGAVQTLLPPVATNQTVTLAENSSTNITLTGFDPQNLSLTYSVLTKPAHGVLSGTPPNLTYQPATNFYGGDSFTFIVNDGVTNSALATISLVVTQVYYPPTANSQTLTNLENAALPVTLTGSDPQNYPLAYSIVTQPSHGILSGTPPNLVYQPATNYFGNDAFTFQANDGVTNSVPATISITVKAVDEPPMVSAGSSQLIILPNNTVNLSGIVTYSEFPDTVDTVIWSEISGSGTVNFGNGSNTTTTATFSTNGVYVLQLYASDSFLSASGDVTITVDAPPVANAGSETTNTFPGSITLQGTASDDGLPSGVLNLNWSEVSGPGTVIFSNPFATNSLATFSTNGIYDLRLTADDGVATNYADVTVIENLPPSVNAGPNILTNGLAAMLNGSVSDDGLPSGYLAVQWVQSSGPGTATFSDPTSTNTAVSVDQSGVFVFTLVATDGAATNSSEVDVTFNLPPVVTAGPEQTVDFGTVVTLAGVATDDHLPYNILDTVWSQVSGPGTATFAAPTLTNTTVTFDQPGVYDLRLTADDGFATNTADVTIQVHGAPIVSAGSNQVTAVGSAVTLAGSFIDDGLAGAAAAQWTQISGPVAATIANPAATNTVVTFSQDGIYTFALTVTDGLTNDSAQVTITVVAPPVVTVAAPSILINWPANQVALNGTATADGLPAGGTLTATWSQLNGPTAATLSNPVQSESLNGSPVSLPSSSVATFSNSGVYLFQLAAANQAGSAQSNVVVTVNQPPLVNAGITQTNLFPATAQLSGAVTDDGLPVGGQLTWSWSVVSGPGTVTFNNAALTNATATFSRSGLYVLQLTAGDSAAISSNQVVIIEDTAPIVRLSTNQVVPLGTNQVTLTGTVADDGLPPGAELTAAWNLVSGPAGVSFSPGVQTSPLSGVPVTNSVQSTVVFSAAGTYVISLTANDSFATNSAAVSLSVTSTPPVVYAGPDLYLSGVPATTTLNGQVTDAVLPLGATLTQQWSVIDGPGTVTFGSPTSPVTTATFSTNGIYVLQLTANNGQSQASDMVEVRVETLCTVEDPEGLAAWWPADGNTMDVVSGQQAILNGTGYTNGEVGLAFNFNGINNSVRVPGGTNYNVGASPSGMTMEFWMNPNSFQQGSVLGWANSIRVERENFVWNGAQLRCYFGTSGQYVQTPSYVWNNNSWGWTHVAVTYDAANGQADIYINGSIQASANVGANLLSTTNDFYMGQVPGSPNFYSGQLDEVSLYRRPLNPEEVYNIYASGSVGKCPDDTNAPPVVSAGPDLFLAGAPVTATLNGQVSDPVLPPGGTLSQQWTVVEGPGTVAFGSPALPVSTATFSTNGIYVLQLTANNGEAEASSLVEVRVESLCTVEDPEGLAAWWPADGTAEDVLSGNYGILGGSTSYTNGEVGSAFNFDGVDDFIDVPGATNYNVGASPSGMTMEFWMNPNSFQQGSVLGWANSIRVERENFVWNGAQLRCYFGTSGQYVQTPSYVWNNNSWGWTHVAVTYDANSGNADIYINGSIQASANVGANLLSTTNDFYMGQVPGSPNFYSGQLDEVSLYRRPLNPEEVYNIYASGSVGKCPDDTNAPPVVSAGPDLFLAGAPATATLNGQVTDPVLPLGGTLSQQWTMVEGPGTVTFGSPTLPVTTATFSANGIYVLQLTANNGEAEASSLVEVRVESLCMVEDPEGLAAWWPADGTAEDVLSGNYGILGGGTSYTNGEVGLAFNFDGVHDFVDVSGATNYNVGASPSGMTMEFWMNPNSFQQGSVLGWANSIRVERENFDWNGAQLRCYFGTSGQYVQTPSYVWNNNSWGWTHVAVTYDAANGQADIYINGSIQASANVGANLLSTTNDFYMGQVPGSPNFYSGQLDEVSLYRRPLNPEEIYSIYASGSVGKCPDDTNTPPVVSAGPDLFLAGPPATATLNGQVTDAVLPLGGTLSQQWSVVEGPGMVAFGSPTSPVTTATFSTNGIYVLRLTANNGEAEASSLVEVRVESLCMVEDPEGLAAWWPADGTAEDIISGNEAILGGGTGYTNGEVALAFNFNGANNFVWAPSATNYNVGTSPSGMTMEFWMNPNSFQQGSVLGWANSIRVERENFDWNGAQLRCYFGTSGQYVQTPSYVWNNNSWGWTHVAVTYDAANGQADIYINGSIQASANVGTNLLSTTNDFYMGQVPGSPNFYSGQLDEVSLYRRPLNPEEIYNVYASGSIGKCPDTNTLAVYAGPNFALPSSTNTALLNGSVTENGQPAGTNVQVQWTEYYGPGTVAFADPTSAVSPVTFSTNGIYVLELSANDEDEESSSLVEVRVGVSCDDEDLSGLSAWWPADGTAEDIIGGNQAILGGGTSYTNGEVALAFNFNGINDFVWAPSATNYNVGASPSGMTMEFWMNPNSFQQGSVLGWANSIRVERENFDWNGAQLRCYFGTSGQYVQTPSYVWNNNSWGWTHVAVTYDATSGTADIYINGSIQASANVGANLLSTTNDFYMGQVPGSPNFYSGQLDEISLYSRPLSAQDISAIYTAGSVGKCPNNLNLIVNQRPSITPFGNLLINWPVNQITLNGAVTDDGLPIAGTLSADWTQVSGPGMVTLSPQPASILLAGDAITNPISTEATFSAPGLYVLQLTVNDTLLTNNVQIVVTVNQPPVVNGGDDQVIPFASSAYLHGTVQDDGLPVGSVVTNEWLQISGPGTATFANPDAAATSVTFNRPGTYQLELLASDTAAFGSNVVTITMVQASSNQPPVVYAGPNQTIGGTNIALLHGVVTGGTPPVTAWWSVESGTGAVTFANSNSPATVATFSAAGTYVLTLSAMDSQYTVSSNVVITIDPNYQLLTVYPGPNQTISTNVTDLPGQVTVDGLTTNTPLTIQWSQVNGPGKAFFAEPSFPNTMASFSQAGSYVLQLSATAGPVTISSNVTIAVLPYDEPPIVNAGVDQEIWNTNQTILQGTVTDPTLPAGATLQTTWSVVSGPNTVTFSNVHATNSAVTFGDFGSYQLRLTATDGILTNSDDVTVISASADTIPYQATNTLYRYGFLTNFFETNFSDSLFTNGQAGFGNYGTCSINSTNFIHTYWPGAVSGVPNLMIRKHFYVPPGTTSLDMGFTVDNDALIYINGILVTPTNIAQFVVNNGSDSRFDSTPSDALYQYWLHDDCPQYDDLVLEGINTNIWFVGENLLAVLTYDDGGVCFFDNRISANTFGQPLNDKAPLPVIANTNPVVVLPSMLYLQAQVEDDGLPTNAPYKNATWSEVNGPGTVTFSQPVSSFLTNNDASTYVSFSAPGTYGLQLLADDSEFEGVAYATVVVLSSSNELITVSAGPDKTVPLDGSATLNGTVINSGSDSGSITTSWSELSGPGTASFTTLNGINYATFSAVGDYVLQFTGSNGQYSNSSTMTVHVVPPINRSLNISTAYPTQTDLTIGANLTAEIIDQEQSAGSVLTDEWVTVSGPAQAVFSQEINNFPDVSAHADFPVAGNYVLGLVAGDGQLLGTAQMPITVTDLYQGRRPPTVSAGQPIAVPVDEPIVLNGTAIDNDATNGTFLTEWSELSGPTQVSFANAAQTNTTATFGAPGNYVLQLTGSDGQFSSSATVAIVATNTASSSLLVYAGGNASLTLPDDLQINGLVIDENPALALSYQWTNISGPGTVVFLVTNITTNATAWLPVEDSAASVIADFSAPGDYQLQLNGTDGTVTNSDILDVTVLPATNTVLSVNAGQPQTIILPNEAALNPIITAVGLSQSSISLAWSQVSGPGTVAFSQFNGGTYASFSAAGVYELQLTATSGSYNASSDVTITVYNAISPPSASIDMPIDATVVTAPTNFIGTASSPILQSYQLQYRFKNADGVAPNPWTTFASGTTSVTNDVLGTLDPTMMLNGIYEIQLVASDSIGQTVATPIQTVSVEKNLKIGNFTLSFQDLNVPVSGIPIQITRTYDSRDQRQDDFGIGWSLGIKNITLQKTRSLGPNWYQTFYDDPFLPYYELDPVQPRQITVTMGNNKVYQFQMQVTPTYQYFAPIESVQVTFTNMPGTIGGLGVDGDKEADIDNSIGYADLINLNDFSYYNPTRFYFTNEIGDVFVIDETNGLESETDPSQNTLLIETNGIIWTNSLIGSSSVGVSFVRDTRGHIKQIIDPAGNTLNYNYDTNGNLISFIDGDTNTTTFGYTNVSFPHYLTTVTSPNGVQAVRTIYDDSGRMIQEIGPNGNVVNFTHDFGNNRDEVTDSLGYTTVNYYDDDGNIIATIDPLDNVTTYQYDSLDDEIQKVDALGGTNSYTYDLQGNQLTATDPLGNTTHYTYGPYRKLTSFTNPLGYTTTNSYDGSGNLIQETDPLGKTTSYSYDFAGNWLTRTDLFGNVTSNTCDSAGHVLSTTVFDAQRGILSISSFTYDSNGNQLSRTLARTTPQGIEDDTTRYVYDGQNRVVETINPDGSSNTTVYAIGLNQPAVQIDPLGRQTFHFYDPNGNETNTIFADGTSVSFSFDADSRKISMTDQEGRTTVYTNDPLGRVIGTRMPDGSSTTAVYDGDGRTIVSSDANGNNTCYGYDAAGQTTSVTNAPGQVTQYQYDQGGNRTGMIDALGRTNQMVYDAMGHQIQTIFPDGTSRATSFDALGRRVYSQDQAGKVTAFGYDALGRVVSVTNALGYVTAYGYDEAGNEVSQTDANNHITTFAYDSMDRRIERTQPGGETETYAYDLAGNVTNHVDFDGHSTASTYDSLNRLLSEMPDPVFGAMPVTFTYTPTGQRATMADTSGQTAYSYNSRDWLTNKTETFAFGNFTTALNYFYDSQGNLTNLATPDGVNVGYAYDSLNRLNAVKDSALGTTAYSYDDVGNLQNCTYPNSISSQFQYDSLNRLTNVAGGQLNLHIANYAYTLGPSGNRLTANEQLFASVLNPNAASINRIYNYDNVYHLTSETINGATSGTIGYDYDPVGNRLARNSTLTALPSQSFSFDADNRLNTDTYDSNGNTLTGPGFDQSEGDQYDFENHLTVRHTASATITIGYDGDGNRVSKTVATAVNTITTLYLVDNRNPSGYAQVLEEFVSTNSETPALRCVYTYGNCLISQSRLNGNQWAASFYGYDGHQNVRYLTDVTGYVTDTYDYDAFGRLIRAAGNSINNYLFTGEQFDTDLGLYYLRARYENPDTGRFWTMDTFEGVQDDPASLHKYLYCDSDPIDFVDPTGLSLDDALFGIFVHQSIGRDFLSRFVGIYSEDGLEVLSNVYSNKSIGRIGGVPATRGTDMALRPDLVDANSGEVYEIKPAGSFSDGLVQLDNYIRILKLLRKDVNWRRGTSFIPKTPVVVLLQAYTVDPPNQGVIIYQSQGGPEDDPVPDLIPIYKMDSEAEEEGAEEIQIDFGAAEEEELEEAA